MPEEIPAGPYPDANPKTVFGVAKPGVHAVPAVALFQMGRAMAYGKAKYGLYNYREHAITASTYFDAAMRHIWRYWDGQDTDPDTCPEDPARRIDHRALAMACLGIWMDAESMGKLNDDRGPPGQLDLFLDTYTIKTPLPPPETPPPEAPQSLVPRHYELELDEPAFLRNQYSPSGYR